MFKYNYLKTLIVAVVILLAAVAGRAQDTKPVTAAVSQEGGQGPQRPQLFRQLGLTRDQIEKIKRLNIDRKPLMEAAQARVREASRLLDQGIYADELDETAIAGKVKDVIAAQAEVQKLRYMNELGVRKILSPEQLVRFRQLREQFAAERQQEMRRRAAGQPLGPNGRPVNRVRPLIRQNQNKPPKTN